MRNQLVYDLPTRLLHWLFAGLFIGAFGIAKIVDDESPIFSYHMLAGFILVFVVILRLLWGIIGTKHSRFTSFTLKPKDLASYFGGILSGDKRKWTGHNPASSWAAIIMFILALGLGITGYLMTGSGNKETYEDLHELMANGFVIVAVLHVAGILLHMLRHQDGIGLSMIDGKKQDIPSTEMIAGQKSAVAILFVGLLATFVVHLVRNFDGPTQTLNVFGTTLQLGESEPEGKNLEHGGRDDDDDND
jgi:cytochrome b